MFEATTMDGTPVTVRASFWQWLKAGIAFSVGASIVAAVVGILKLLTFLSAVRAFVDYLSRH